MTVTIFKHDFLLLLFSNARYDFHGDLKFPVYYQHMNTNVTTEPLFKVSA